MLRLLSLAATVACCAALEPVPIPWQQAGGDPARSGNNHRADPVNQGAIAWQHTGSTQAIRTSPVVGPYGIVYYTTPDKNVTALYTENGVEAWSRTMSAGFWASPALSNDALVLYAADLSGVLYAFDAMDGTVKWTISVEGSIVSSPAVDENGYIYFASTSGNGAMHSIHSDKSERWHTELQGGVATPALVDGNVFAVSREWERIVSYTAEKGRLNFLLEVETVGELSDVTACPPDFWGGNGAIVYGDDNTLVAYDGKDGSLLWKKPTGEKLPNHEAGSTVAFGDDGTLYWGSPDGYLYAVNGTGDTVWRHQFNSGILGGPVVGLGQVFAVSFLGEVRCLDSTSGDLFWKVQVTQDGVSATPALGDDGLLYITGWDGSLYAIGEFTPPILPSHSPAPKSGGGGLGAGAVAGITIAVLAVAIAAGFFVYTKFGSRIFSGSKGYQGF